jgi:hypothetical protein
VGVLPGMLAAFLLAGCACEGNNVLCMWVALWGGGTQGWDLSRVCQGSEALLAWCCVDVVLLCTALLFASPLQGYRTDIKTNNTALLFCSVWFPCCPCMRFSVPSYRTSLTLAAALTAA